MKTLYLDCGMGAAGDMLSAALLELLPDPDAFVAKLNALGIPGVVFTREASCKCGIRGTHMSVTVHGEAEGEHHHHHHHHEHEHEHEREHEHTHEHEYHHHSSMHDIEHIVCSHLDLPEQVKSDILAVYKLIAEAESHAHGVPVSEIHFHEVGSMDAIADITAVCLLLHRLAPDEIIVSPVHVGCGEVHCAHGILPVPAPATAHILRGVPIYGGQVRGELCTPTGAALLRHFATRFGAMPAMRVSAIGYGMGKKDFPRANCVRAMLGETEDHGDEVTELSCNLDDMSAEDIAYAMDVLLAAGALDVWTAPIGMKKSRPGTMLSVLCHAETEETMLHLLFRHTSTIGIRKTRHSRCTLRREMRSVETPYGTLEKKISSGYGVTKEKFEHDALERVARENGISIAQVLKTIKED